jgi:hypothetical protein
MDTLLIGLHSSFAAAFTNLSFCTPKPFIKEITSALEKFEDNKTMCLLYSGPPNSWLFEQDKRLRCIYISSEGINVNNMNVNPGGKQWAMRDTVIPLTNPSETRPT